MKRSIVVVCALALSGLLAGCGERAQESASAKKKPDAAPWTGGESGSVAGSWKAGDAKSWEEQMRNRAQRQNEYARTTP